MTDPQNDISDLSDLDFPKYNLIQRTTPMRCAELSVAWYNGTLHEMMEVEPELKQVCENLCNLRAYDRRLAARKAEFLKWSSKLGIVDKAEWQRAAKDTRMRQLELSL